MPHNSQDCVIDLTNGVVGPMRDESNNLNLSAELYQTNTVDMFNDNQLFQSDIDTGRSKDVTIMEDLAAELALPHQEENVDMVSPKVATNVFTYQPSELKKEIAEQLPVIA